MSVADLDKCLEDIARQAIVLMDKSGIKHSDFSGLDRINKELLDINENDEDSDRSCINRCPEKAISATSPELAGLLEKFSGAVTVPFEAEIVYVAVHCTNCF